MVQRSALCRSRGELSNAYLVAKFGFDTAENEPLKVDSIIQLWDLIFTEPPRPSASLSTASGHAPAAHLNPRKPSVFNKTGKPSSQESMTPKVVKAVPSQHRGLWKGAGLQIFPRPILGCIDADFCKWTLILQNLLRYHLQDHRYIISDFSDFSGLHRLLQISERFCGIPCGKAEFRKFRSNLIMFCSHTFRYYDESDITTAFFIILSIYETFCEMFCSILLHIWEFQQKAKRRHPFFFGERRAKWRDDTWLKLVRTRKRRPWWPGPRNDAHRWLHCSTPASQLV